MHYYDCFKNFISRIRHSEETGSSYGGLLIMKTIAIIDDDIYIGDMLEEVLQSKGYAVLRAYSGTEAL